MGRAKGNPTVLQMDIIDLLSQGLSTKEVCAKLDCSPETIRVIKSNSDLKQLFYNRCREQVSNLIPVAIKRLRNILNDDNALATAHLAACKEVLERSHLSELTDNTNTEIKVTVSYE